MSQSAPPIVLENEKPATLTSSLTIKHELQQQKEPPTSRTSNRIVYQAWLGSRLSGAIDETPLVPGAQRPFSRVNLRYAFVISRECIWDLAHLLWGIHPLRTAAMLALNVLRGLFPAFRGYSQALIVNELQLLLSTKNWQISHFFRLILGEVSRMALESIVDSLATKNENIVNNAARYVVEYQQMDQRARLDGPALADPITRDLLQESDLFVGTFAGMGGFGLLSPLDLVRIITLVSELFAHAYILLTLTRTPAHALVLLLSLLSSLLPLVDLAAWFGLARGEEHRLYTAAEARLAEQQHKMRTLVHCDPYRAEILVFGLSSWIVESWSSARRVMLGLEKVDDTVDKTEILSSLLAQINAVELVSIVQNLPVFIFLQSSASSLGSVALYRNSVQALLFTARGLVHTLRIGFSSIFLMGAFCAARGVQPRLQPSEEQRRPYATAPGGGMKIEASNISFAYPGCKEPALKSVNFTVEAGETLAIVGPNGSGKSTLASLLLRLAEYDTGSLRINGVDLRALDTATFRARTTAVLQGFARFEASARENIGLGSVAEMHRPGAVERAARAAGAHALLGALPRGLDTRLDSLAPHLDFAAHASLGADARQGLSGGEWQRIAISRAFMRAVSPQVDLMIFDEPTSALDAHAQNTVFDAIDALARGPSGAKSKTVIFITHRLSTARRADKVLMLENGVGALSAKPAPIRQLKLRFDSQ